MIGRVIQGNFEILDKIGQGGMASVYRARQKSLDRVVAVKMLSGDLPDTMDFRERFEQEAKIIARLMHPNIVQVFDVCEMEDEEGGLCIVMEYIDGRPLNAVLREQRPLPVERAVAIGKQIATGLGYAHGEGVIHRDIKPQNIMLLKDDWVKIMDFGIARLHGSSIRTLVGATMGTPEYMSPEQAEGKPVDHRSDIYSLAVVLYGMVTGELPFWGDNPVAICMKHVQAAPRPPREIIPSIPPAIESVILKGMAKKPSERFQSGEEFRDALTGYTPAPAMSAMQGTQLTATVQGMDGEPQTVVAESAPSPSPAVSRPDLPEEVVEVIEFLRENGRGPVKWGPGQDRALVRSLAADRSAEAAIEEIAGETGPLQEALGHVYNRRNSDAATSAPPTCGYFPDVVGRLVPGDDSNWDLEYDCPFCAKTHQYPRKGIMEEGLFNRCYVVAECTRETHPRGVILSQNISTEEAVTLARPPPAG